MATRGSWITSIVALAVTLALASGCVAAGAGPLPSADATRASSAPAVTPPSSSSATAASQSPAASGSAWPPGRYSISYDPSNVLDLLADGTAYLTEQPFVTSRDEYRVTGETVTFAGESCGGVTGTYRWSYTDPSLQLLAVEDPCADRSALLGLRLDRVREQLPYLAVQPSRVLDQPDYNFSTVDADGNFYVTDGTTGFYEHDADGMPVRAWPGSLSYTTGITVTPDGTIYVANFDPAAIHVFSAAGKPVRSWTVDGGKIGPVGLAHDAKGDIYVALHRLHDHYVEKYSPTGKLLDTWAGAGWDEGDVGTNPGPSAIAVLPDGTSYLGDPGNNRVVKFAPDGTFLSNLTGDGTPQLVSPSVVAADASGNVFALSRPLKTLWEFDDAGSVVGRWFSPYDANVVVDDGGAVWLVADRIMAVRLPGS